MRAAMREELQLNRTHWDEATRIHTRGNVYGIDDFRAGGCRLHRVELEEVGDVRGKRLLHLQCHFGLDTLSWARRGARVTGVDLSPEAIDFARGLARETNLDAEFVCSDVYAVEAALDRPQGFDIVFTSYGALNWLPDLQPWARLIARYLAPGGFFYVVEQHPTSRMFPIDSDMPQVGTFRPIFPYFHDPAGVRYSGTADYADPNATHAVDSHEWQHSLGDIVNALLQAGLRLDFLHEFPYCAWEVVAGVQPVEVFSSAHAYYARPASEVQLPLMFSLKATRPER